MSANDLLILQVNGSNDFVERLLTGAASGKVIIINASNLPELRGLEMSDISGLVTALAAKIASTEKGAANGVATLGADSKVPASQLPASVVGAVDYKGTWDASANTPTIPAASSSNKGFYYVVSVAGSTEIDGCSDWKVGDWIISNGTAWSKVDNTDAVSSVAGKTGAVTLDKNDVGLGNVSNALQLLDSNKDTDGTLAANSDTKIPSQKAVKTYADTLFGSTLAWVSAPAAANSTGTAGQIAYDGQHIYLCVASNSWVRAASAKW